MTIARNFSLTIATTAWLAVATRASAHEHLAAGATSTTPGSPLILVNAADYSADSGFVFNLEAGEPASPYEGYYFTGDLTFEALAATPPFGGHEDQSAALGSHIEAVLQTVDGPSGGHFSFWEAQPTGGDSTNVTWTVPAGSTNGTNHIVISQTDGSPTADPFGHIHGRVYSVDQPGLYRVGFQFVDTSTNGPSGGPIQAPSDRFYLYFQADVTIGAMNVASNQVNLTFAAPSKVPEEDPDAPPASYQIESTPTLGLTADWQPSGDVVAGDDHLHTITLPMTNGSAFYRLNSY